MTLEELRKITRRTVQSAGPRYTPGVDAGAPNLHIAELERAIAGLAVNGQFSGLLSARADSLLLALDNAGSSIATARDISDGLRESASSLKRLALLSPTRGKSLFARLLKAITKLNGMIEHESERVSNLIRKKNEQQTYGREGGANGRGVTEHRNDPENDRLKRLDDALRSISIECRRTERLLESNTLKLRFSNRALLLGPWGSGKTHFLCDASLALLSAKLPAVALLAKDISGSGSIVENFEKTFGRKIDEVLCDLDALGRSANVRALLIIDGINEGDFDSWRKFVYHLTSRVKRHQFVGLVLSCRTPMETLLFSERTRKQYVHLRHPGFGDVEFNAQRAFFSFYGVPLPDVPLLTEEFSRPLTLKILCESFAELPKKEQRRGFVGLTSGQKGMTFVLESFVKRRTSQLEQELNLPQLFCWKLIKGDDAIRDHCLSGLAPYMAENMVEAVSFKDAIRILRARPEVRSNAAARSLLTRLIQEGVIHDYTRWVGHENAYERVIALPYQRFSDHIIARHLLARHLDKTDESTIRASLQGGTPLGRIFEQEDEWSTEYSNPALAEAVIIEFPETVKKKIAEGKRELYFFLPKGAQRLNGYYSPFLDGFSWRSPTTIDASTERIVGALVNPKYPQAYRRMMDTLVMVATKPAHPFSAERLWGYLDRLRMSERDLSWSEALRNTEPGSSVDRVIHFYSEAELNSLSFATASLAVILLASFLTTTDRLLRDKATLGLVRVGEHQPGALFGFVEAALMFNDPYVSERVLAAIYGVTMSLWSTPNNDFRVALSNLTTFLVKEMFVPEGRFKTCHVLTRDYALGVIELSKRVVPAVYPPVWEQYLVAPFVAIPSPFPESRRISPSTTKKVSSAIHMDFGNYTLGRLIRERSNYDFSHPTYKSVRRQIEWRMAKLGYSYKAFEAVDREIARSQSHSRGDTAKVNRYGKKYAWIAYFEMYGLRQAQGLIDRSQRSGDCDIDPSFPIEEKVSMPPMSAFFGRKRLPKKHARWLKSGLTPDYSSLLRRSEIDGLPGPWRLVCGFINEEDKKTLHQLWAHIHIFLVADENIEELKTEFSKEGFPPHEISRVAEDHYTYAGEIGWSQRFGSRYGNDAESDYTISAYSSHKRIPVTEALKKGWRCLDYALVLKFFKSRTETSKKRNRSALVRHLAELNGQLSACDQLTISEVTDLHEIPRPTELNSGYATRKRWTNVGGLSVEPVAWHFAWESYHSELNQVQFYVPTPSFCEALGLRPQLRSTGLYEPSGTRATLFAKGGDSHSDSTTLLYVREDLLHRYAEMRGKRIVCLSWGERQVHHTISDAVWQYGEQSDHLTTEDTLFKRFELD